MVRAVLIVRALASVSAIIPATDSPRTLARCLAALGAHADEVIVVQDPPGANPAQARNLGASRATGEILLFVDADVVVHADAVDRIRARFDGTPDLVALFGSYDDDAATPGVVASFRNLLHHHVHHESPGPARTFWTGLGAVRREAFEQMHGFDERVEFMEDIDFGMRLSAEGSLIELDPSVQGTHLKRWTLSSMVETDFWRRAVPWTELLLRHGSSGAALNLGWRHRASALASVAGAVALLARRRRAATCCVVALVALNHRFYALLYRTRGPAEAVVGVGLHALHHLVSVAGVPVGVLRHLARARRERR